VEEEKKRKRRGEAGRKIELLPRCNCLLLLLVFSSPEAVDPTRDLPPLERSGLDDGGRVGGVAPEEVEVVRAVLDQHGGEGRRGRSGLDVAGENAAVLPGVLENERTRERENERSA